MPVRPDRESKPFVLRQNLGTLSRSAMIPTVFFVGLLGATSASAFCSTSGDRTKCTGEWNWLVFAEGDNDDGETIELDINSVTNSSFTDTLGFPAVQVLGSSGDSDDGPRLMTKINLSPDAADVFNLDGDPSDFILTTNDLFAILIGTTGADGSNASKRKNIFATSAYYGHDGDDGGAGGEMATYLTALTINSELSGLDAGSTGGDGGNGGEAQVGTLTSAHGGTGGSGGDTGYTVFGLTDTKVFKSSSSVSTIPLVNIVAQAGDGGTGGTARAGGDPHADGGTGGAGGSGGEIDFIFYGDVTIDSKASGGVALWIESDGGDGGTGGYAHNSDARAYGGDGGAGGSGGRIHVDLMTGDSSDVSAAVTNVLLYSVGAPALVAQSVAGDGGDGGTGSSGLSKGYGGDGGSGGNAQLVDIEVIDGKSFDVITTGDYATGVFGRSYGGAGGDGGDGEALFGSGGGGDGAGSGNAGTVEFSVDNGFFATDGDFSDAILLQSVGGFAGDGGDASGIVAYGGGSESAGTGGKVTATLTDTAVQALGDYSDGLHVQSIGGGGGKGGDASGIASLSGSGGAGGDSDDVTIELDSSKIETFGDNSSAIMAQSIGGGGGDSGSASGLVSIGGSGSVGGSGALVSITVDSDSSLQTFGDYSDGILAQSIGGGGGSGGMTGSIFASIGGDGGSGADGGMVYVYNAGDVLTEGDYASGIVGQSIGGSGGHGSNATAVGIGFELTMSGSGGTGSDGKTVLLSDMQFDDLDYVISTEGDYSVGVLGQSIGGGGGNAGNALSAGASTTGNIAIAIGGTGGAGGDGGHVDVYHRGGVTTVGDHSSGILASSAGGGGGNAGSTLALTAASGAGALDITVGGDGGGAGDGGLVNVCRAFTTEFSVYSDQCEQTSSAESSLSIETEGDISHGILASSVGGSGGHSGVTLSASGLSAASLNISVGGNGGAGGTGGQVFVATAGGISTEGDLSHGILAKSVGGSGGAAYMAGSASAFSATSSLGVSVGGDGGSGGVSDSVFVYSEDDITTTGANAGAIVAMSAAGGGGAGGIALAADAVAAASLNVSMGGEGGDGGTADTVRIITTGDIKTSGDLADGIVGLSLGGPGGVGGTSLSGTLASFGSAELSVGGAAGDGGTADEVAITTEDGSITTAGDLAMGIYAASIGGSGGKGGAAISTTGVSQEKASLTIGGDGGDGGVSGSVYLTLEADVTTTGVASAGVMAQSLGGSGGAGGYAAQGGISASFDPEIPTGSATFVFGGDGGDGGEAGLVSVDSSGAISTGDFSSPGIIAQSIGGTGGAGGNVYSGNAQVGTEGTNISVEFDVGGDGGSGGAADVVLATNESGGSITTSGHASQGIIAQSIGGNGGAGGSSYNAAVSLQDQSDNSVSLMTVIGGDGGDGGAGGEADVSNHGSIVTTGDGSAGLYAQSIGGNGGIGGTAGNISFSTDFSSDDEDDGESDGEESEDEDSEEDAEESTVNFSIGIRVGGAGGDGAVAGPAFVSNMVDGEITTSGANSHGMFAQSIGGNGGDGGSTGSYDLSVSGICDFTQVRVKTDACEDEDEDDSEDSDDSDEDEATESELSFTGTFGGDGGSGMDADLAWAYNTGSIGTSGEASHGIFVQSIGGGGGVGGSTGGGLETFTSNQTAQDIDSVYEDQTDDTPYEELTNFTDWNLTIGGAGGAAGQGGAATVYNEASIVTSGDASYGIFAQSVGGGGGTAGSAGGEDTNNLSIGSSGGSAGDGGIVTITSGDGSSITTNGQRAHGIVAQSIGGGGGTTDVDPGIDLSDLESDALLNFTIGGQEGAAGDGGAVTISNTNSSIVTNDFYSAGIFAQSVGGGGGAAFGGIEGITGSTTVGGQGDTDVSDDDTDYGTTTGDGGDVSVDHTGAISTAATSTSSGVYGSAGFGIFAQSVGGGGGYAGTVIFGASSYFGSDLTDMSGDTDTSGDGGDVSVTATGNITTRYGAAVGIFAQSVGGGGGVAGMSDSTNVLDPTVYIGNGGGSGRGGTVTVDYSDGSIYTSGKGAHGIFAQSAGGPSSTTTTDTMVSVTVGGDINVSGRGSHGIFAQSVGEGMGKIAVEIAEGATVSGGKASFYDGAEDGAGVFIKNGTNENTLINNGTITSTLGSDGVAINVKDTTVTVTNSGTIIGEWIKASEIHAHNIEGGRIHAGDVFMADTILNEGHFAIGDPLRVGNASVEGDFTQGETGNLVITLDPGIADATSRTDNLTIQGDAKLSGTVAVDIANGWSPGYGNSVSQFLTVEGSSDLSDLEIRPSAAGQYQLSVNDVDGTSHLHHDIDFANETILNGVNENQRRIAQVIHDLYIDPDFQDEDYATLLLAETPEDFGREMNTFGSEVLSHAQIASLQAALRFRDDLLSCPQREGDLRFFDLGKCTWFRLGGEYTEQDSSSETLGFQESSWRFAAGGQAPVSGDWILGWGGSYETIRLNTEDADASSNGERFQLGATVKRVIGNVELAAALSVGKAENDITRNPTIGGTATGKQDIWSYGAHLRASTLIERENWFLMPQLGLGIDHQHIYDYSETGGTYALAHDTRDDTNVHVSLGADFGWETLLQNGTLARPRLSLGVTHFLTNPSPEATTGFVNSDISNFSFDGGSSLDRTRLDIAAGLDLFMNERSTLRIDLGGSLSENSRSIGGEVKLAIQF